MVTFISPSVLHQRHYKTIIPTTSPTKSHTPYFSPIHRIKQAQVRQHVRQYARSDFRMESSNAAPSPQEGVFTKVWDSVTLLFPVWTIIAAGIALAKPTLFGGLTKGVLMRRMLSVLMLSTGLTLTGSELVNASRRPWLLLFAFLCCYAVMPGLAFLLVKLFRLRGVDGAGLLLLGAVSGGQTSNLCTLIAGGDVALSVAMTTLTSVASVIVIPSLSAWLLGQAIDVNPIAVGRSTVELVALPILLGAGLNTLFPGMVRRIKGALPAIGIGAVLVLIVGPVAETSDFFFSAARTMALPVVLLHILGGLIGLVIPLLFSSGRKIAVTTAFEAGFKSPVLSFVLARTHFGDGVGMASVVSIVVLAPLAAFFAVVLRILGRSPKVEKEMVKEVVSTPVLWKGYVGAGDAGSKTDNTRSRFKVVGHDGKTSVVRYEHLKMALERARRRGGVRLVERVTE